MAVEVGESPEWDGCQRRLGLLVVTGRAGAARR
jgi:hypothetical protein